MPNADTQSRQDALRRLLGQGTLSTQEELVEKLERLDFSVTQSTVSRDLRKLGAVRATDATGRTVYRLPEESLAPVTTTSLRELVLSIRTNGSIIAIRTSPGSASLVARHIDATLPTEILGTIAGDDTIFAAPASVSRLKQTVQMIEHSLNPV